MVKQKCCQLLIALFCGLIKLTQHGDEISQQPQFTTELVLRNYRHTSCFVNCELPGGDGIWLENNKGKHIDTNAKHKLWIHCQLRRGKMA